MGTELAGVSGEAGAFVLTLRQAGGDRPETLDTTAQSRGAIIIATGFSHFDPGRATQMYGYYEFPTSSPSPSSN